MELLYDKVSVRTVAALLLLTLCSGYSANAWLTDTEYSVVVAGGPDFVSLDHARHRRDAPTPAAPSPSPAASPASQTDDANRTTNVTSATAVPAVSVTQTPLLGVNGSGIYKGNNTENMPKVSEPISADDNITTANFEEQLEMITAQHNLTDLREDHHIFYNSTFIGNLTYFQEHWANITKPKPNKHKVLSNSHRRATQFTLSFKFPFYGHLLENITVATGGFIYTGEHVHNWLAATQYIAPLMANFDTTLTNESNVILYDNGEQFTALWENVNLREDRSKNFTFAVTLYQNGDIVFAYKDVPMPVQVINDNDHPVKVGISDAYLTDRMLFYVRRKTIYEYHRITYKNHNITSNTILRMTALPTCLQYHTCQECANHDTGFNCSWCEEIQKCSSGTDRNKQDWVVRGCDRRQIVNETSCPAARVNGSAYGDGYVTDTRDDTRHATVVKTQQDVVPRAESAVSATAPARASGSAIGLVLSAFILVALVASLAAWMLYAFKNPHTRSGQFLIKYRPSQWSWRRGEARYTAATIHM